jgi:hypothetical protein
MMKMKTIFKAIVCIAVAVTALSAQEKPATPPAGSASPARPAAPAKKIDAASVGVPKLAANLKPGTWKYKTTVEMGSRDVPVSIVTEIKEDGNSWAATSTMEGYLGEIIDTTHLDKGTLVLHKLEHKQGRISYQLDFTDSMASGKFESDGLEKPLSGTLTGPVFANAAGAPQVIGCLPLAAGYSALFRNFDVRQQKERLMQLKVAAVEKVTVPAGTFEAYRVEVTSADDGHAHQTLWIDKNSRQLVKLAAVLPMGSTMTEELDK